jgi:hypothetical protein
MHPDWLGSPQHFVVALVLAAAVAFAASRRFGVSWWIAGGLGLGAAATAEIAYELVEYPLRYADEVNLTAYHDTLADLASSLAGGLVGGVAGAWLGNRG